jgi:hypothetical protein
MPGPIAPNPMQSPAAMIDAIATMLMLSIEILPFFLDD